MENEIEPNGCWYLMARLMMLLARRQARRTEEDTGEPTRRVQLSGHTSTPPRHTGWDKDHDVEE